MTTSYERMHDGMHKIHGNDGTVWHISHADAIDRGDCHDHPWPSTSEVVFGGYDEIAYDPATGAETLIERREGDIFRVEAQHIHRIVRFTGPLCITRIRPEAKTQEPGFWRWIDGKAQRRDWNGEWEDRA